jgi:N-formylglutamate deformylase
LQADRTSAKYLNNLAPAPIEALLKQLDLFEFIKPDRPLLVSFPHSGVFIPKEQETRMSEAALARPDTDWHLPLLYDFLRESGAGMLIASHSRYVVDLNRDPSGEDLYPGADNTELCPSSTFEHEALYRDGAPVSEEEVAVRIEQYWRPYHQRLQGTLDEMVARFGKVVLFDAHSIRGRVPRFFDGVLPDLNLGSASGHSASPDLVEVMMDCLSSGGYSTICNGRFKGGYITRHYGVPSEGVHAVQLEMVQDNYMDEIPPFEYRPDRANNLKDLLGSLMGTVLQWSESANDL